MSQELFFTSAPRGLQAGSSGFCTVAVTRGLPPPLRERLEALSAYRHLLPPLDPNNPVAYSHLRLSVGGRTYHALSRIGPAGLDYSQRSNKFAHHVVLGPGELPPGGPAWLLQQPGFMEPIWDGMVRELPAGRTPPMRDGVPALCGAWQKLAGDAGWAGVVAEAVERDLNQTVYFVFQPGQEMLPLLAEAMALLPPEKRWQITFSTYYTGAPPGTSCAWRCVAKGSAEAKEASGLPNALVLDLTAPLPPARGGPLVEQARNGRPTTATPPLRAEPEWPGAVPPIPSRRAERVAAPVRRPAMLPPPPPPAPVATEPRNRWRTQGLWMMIGLLIGLLTSSGVTVALAQFGAVNLELARNQDELATDIRSKQTELENAQNRLTEVSQELQSKERRANELKERQSMQENQVAELSAKMKANTEELRRIDGELTEKRGQLAAINKDKEAKADELKELPALRKIIEVLNAKTASGGQGILLQSAIDRFRKDPQLENPSHLEKAYDEWYAFRIKEESEPYRLWSEAEGWIGNVKSVLVKEERQLELSEKIMKNCEEIRTKYVRSLAAKKILENGADVLDACKRVLDSSKSEARKADAKKIQEWLKKNANRSK